MISNLTGDFLSRCYPFANEIRPYQAGCSGILCKPKIWTPWTNTWTKMLAIQGVSVQEMWCCAVSRLRLNQTLIANNIVDFVSMCFTLQMDPDFAREALVRSFVNPFPGFTRCGGNPGWNPWRPCASIQEMWSRHNFILFSGPLCLPSFLDISGVRWISTLSEQLSSMLIQHRGFSKFSRFLPVCWLSYVPGHMRTRFPKTTWKLLFKRITI